MYDIIIRGGTIYDGSGEEPFEADVAIAGHLVAAVQKNIKERASCEVDASGLAVAPGFINMLSWANESLIADGRSQSDIRQGVTLEVMGEGSSMGPLNEEMKKERQTRQGDIKYDVTWTRLSEYLEFLVQRGISTNVGSFVGATTVRRHVIGNEDRPPTQEELLRMQALVQEAMQEGAFGVASALIYAPAFYAQTDELIALATVAAEYGGMYCSHLRSEGNAFLEAIDELIETAEKSQVRAEIYHLKAAGRANWPKMDAAIAKIERARQQGLQITADMYMYTAAQTGLDASMPPWVQEGGEAKWIERLKNPSIRARVKEEMLTATSTWENGYLHAGAEGMVLVEFKSERLKPLTGKTLKEISVMRGQEPEDAIMDLVIEDDSRIEVVYFWMCEENVRKQLTLPWISVGSDGSSLAPEGVFMKASTHPRAYGNVARFLGKYVREEKVTTLQDAVRRLTSLPATNLRLERRGFLRPGYFADVVSFDPSRINDKATFEKPHQFAEGVRDVFVNGTQVLRGGDHTGATPGQAVFGPGKLVNARM